MSRIRIVGWVGGLEGEKGDGAGREKEARAEEGNEHGQPSWFRDLAYEVKG